MSHNIDKSEELEQVKINPNNMKCWYVCRNTDYCETCERGQQVKLLASNCGIEPYEWLDKFRDNHIDTASYRILQEYKQNIRKNVENAKSLYICSKNHSTGKTSWSIKILYTYIDQIWADNEMQGIDGKTIVCGHWNTSWAHKKFNGYDKEFLGDVETMWMDENGIIHPTVCYDIFYGNGIIGLDACTVISHKVNVLVLEDL